MSLSHASSLAPAPFIRLVSVTRISEEAEPPAVKITEFTEPAPVTSAGKESEATDQGSKNQTSLQDRLDSKGDNMQESEGPEDTSSGQEVTAEVTIEEDVASKRQVISGSDVSDEHMKDNTDGNHHSLPPSPSLSPIPPQQPDTSEFKESTTAVAVVTVAALSQISIGATHIWSHILLYQLAKNTTTLLNTDLYLSRSLVYLADYLLLAGLVTFLVPSGWLVSKLGRRRSLVAATFASIISWALHALTPNDSVLLTGRFFAGLSSAMLKVSVTTYVTEVTVISDRGQALVCLEIMNITGGLLCLGLSWLLPWYHIAFVNLVWMAICGGLFLFFFPESPFYLVMQSRQKEAQDALQRLRAQGCNVGKELQIIKSYNPPEKANAKFSSLFLKPFISPTMALVGLSVVSEFSGSAVIIVNGADMMVRSGYRSHDIAVVLVLIALVSGGILLFGFVDRIGRRLCLLVSLGILVLTYSGLGAIAYVLNVTPGRDSTADPTLSTTWAIVRICLILLAAFSLTFGTHTIPTILAAEYFPAYLRPQGLAVFFTANKLVETLTLHLHPLIEERLGLHDLYWLFALIALLGIVYTNFCVYEIRHQLHRLSATCKWLYRENFYEPRPFI